MVKAKEQNTDEMFAQEIENLSDEDLWKLIGKEMQKEAREMDAEYIGFSLSYSAQRYFYNIDNLRREVDIANHLTFVYKQGGYDAVDLSENAVAQESDAYVVFPASSSAVVLETVREKIPRAIRG